ncbi:hypothetical protein [Actinocatenispora rupis]|uniref:Translation initiation factor n=1 Tax=Actinocatenispora rupis TaxID=519421 RepID=A0A8J3J5R0_9ACTN|nr:hypothetical protein [Actinocatenispora rupis]GID12595.1 hypothetical protein Aru02nite_34840 [Actinocatenispora rupis]
MAAPRGLSVDDIETLRTAVGSGRRPKVVFTAAAGQIAGQTGQVTEVGDPSTSDEYISVRFGRDKLEFAPSDLQLPGKTTGRRTKPAEKPAADKPAAAKPTPAAPAPTPASSPAPAAVVPAASPAPATTSARTTPARRGKTKGPAELSVTLSWQEGDWSVQAHRGAKVLAKPTPVRAADALRMVGMLDTPAVTDAVTEIVSAARSAAADRAEQLRQELAEVEARLAELPDID